MSESRYRIIFEKHGQLKNASGSLENEVWIDVGNELSMGCFDHHQTDGALSAFSAVINNVRYLEKLKISYDRGDDITVHIHEQPDLDCISSYYAVRYYLEHSETEFMELFGTGEKGRQLEKYINDIDTGKNKIATIPTLYAIFSVLDRDMEKSEQTDEYVVEKGLELIEEALEMLDSEDIDLANYDCTHRLRDRFEPEINAILKSINAYEEDKRSKAVVFESILVWTKEGKLKAVPAAVWKGEPKDSNEYDFARKEGNVVTVVPRFEKHTDGTERARVFASINPDIDTENNLTLRPLAEIIEQMEQMEEQGRYEHTGIYRRDHSRPRELKGHFSKMPFAATSDPWYISETEDVFDAPRAGSVLDYKSILEVIRNNASAVRKSYAIVLGEKRELIYNKQMISLNSWIEEMCGILKENSQHVVVWGELDSSLLSKSNRILRAYCMNLVGRSFYEESSRNIMFLDYRTCVYSDLNCTIILTATYREHKESSVEYTAGKTNYDEFPIAGILKTSTEKDFEESVLVKDIAAIAEQRSRLLSLGTRIGELQPGERKIVEGLNRELLLLSRDIQKTDMIEDSVEREIYSFIKKEFEIERLKTSVMEEMRIIVSESRNNLVSGFNTLSAFAVPFIIIATVFQMGFIRFQEAISLSGAAAYLGWCGVIVLVAVLIAFLKDHSIR